jgi:hypothetical protein
MMGMIGAHRTAGCQPAKLAAVHRRPGVLH